MYVRSLRSLAALPTLAATFLLAAATPAAADFLHWGSTGIKTGSTKIGYDFARDVMRAERASGVRSSTIEVAGVIEDCYVAITIIGTAPRATAMVMVIGKDNAKTMRVRDRVQSKIAGVTRID